MNIPNEMKTMSLDELLEEIQVVEDTEGLFPEGIEGWYGVTNTEGIIAYFGDEDAAFSFRLTYINNILILR